MNPEEYKKLYGHYPSPELMAAWESGPQATKSFDNPVREAIHAAVEPLTSRSVMGLQDSEDVSALGGMRAGATSLLDPALYVSGVGDVISGLSSETDDPSLMDWGMAALDVGPLAWAKAAKPALQSFRANMKNRLEFASRGRAFQPPAESGVGETLSNLGRYTPAGGFPEQRVSFYSGHPVAKLAAMGEGFFKGTKDFVKQLYSLSDSHRWRTKGVSKQKADGIRQYIDSTDELLSNPKSWVTDKSGVSKLSTAAKKQQSILEKTVAGDLNTMVKLAEREGLEMSPSVRMWNDIHWGESTHINADSLGAQLRGLNVSKSATPTQNSDLIADMMNRSWKTEGRDYILAIQKPRKSAGSATSTSDAQMTPSYVAIAKAYHSGARTVDEFRAAFKSLDWKPGIGNIKEGADGSILFSYSPQRKSDFFKGGFNTVAEVTPNGRTTFWVSDEFDLAKGPVKAAMELGMKHRLLTVMNPKTIRTPNPGSKTRGLHKNIRQASKDVEKVPIKQQELSAMEGLLAETDIPALYKARFLATRYGAPAVVAGGLIPDKKKRLDEN
jgi:hypothetical protein